MGPDLKTFNSMSSFCFGTATFVQGKLRPTKDSAEGLRTLDLALRNGINVIHSNPKLETQWAIKTVLDQNQEIADSVFNLIKVEIPLETNLETVYNIFCDRLEHSLSHLNTNKIYGVIYEVDSKRTSHNKLRDNELIKYNYEAVRDTANHFINIGKMNSLICMTKNTDELNRAIDSKCFDAYAGYYNLFDIWPTYSFDRIFNEKKYFIGVQPLKYGIFTDSSKDANHNLNTDDTYKTNLIKSMGDQYKKIMDWCKQYNCNHTIQELALRFVSTHSVVKTNIIGVSTQNHLNDILKTKPFSIEEFYNIRDKIADINGM